MELPAYLQSLQERTAAVVEAETAPRSSQVDQAAQWPAHSMKALGEAGLLGLMVPAALGGHGQGLQIGRAHV